MTDMTAPTTQSDRIGEVDFIRGFALFGVLWMNIYGHGEFLVLPDKIHGLPHEGLEGVFRFLSDWLMHGKAQALFSLLFGFGFAIMMERTGARGGDGTKVYLRRLTVLLIIGLAHVVLLWMGDILNAYAAMGFLLLLTRRWGGGWLLVVGLALAVLAYLAVGAYYQITSPDGPPPFVAILDAGAAARWPVVMGNDYPAYVVALFKGTFVEFYRQPIAMAYLGTILGRFMLGSWIHRQGWLQDTQRHLRLFRLSAATLVPAGLALGLIRPAMQMLELRPADWARPLFWSLQGLTPLVLALGYGALIIVLCRSARIKRALSGLGAVGQMALTNYLTQSLVFVFVLYGFGLGLLPWMGPTLSLALAVVVFAAQIAFSRWWLARYRFGPMEWLWRWATYGQKPELRRTA